MVSLVVTRELLFGFFELVSMKSRTAEFVALIFVLFELRLTFLELFKVCWSSLHLMGSSNYEFDMLYVLAYANIF